MRRADNVLFEILDQYTGENSNYIKITNYVDGSIMTDDKCDSVIYRKFKNEYFKRIFDGTIKIEWFGAIANDGNDHTSAFQKAINFINNQPQWSGSSSNRGSYRYIISLDTGVYNIRAGFLNILKNGVTIVGEGKRNTCIYVIGNEDAPVFDVGTFTTTVNDIYVGVSDFCLKDLRIQRSGGNGVMLSRVGQAVRQTGGGDLCLIDVYISGFKYGINSVCGGDFNTYIRSKVEYCDYGVYLGPGSQQIRLEQLDIYACYEGLIIDRCQQGISTMLNIGNCQYPIIFELLSYTTSRQLDFIGIEGGSPKIQLSLTFDGTWLESNAGQQGRNYTVRDYITFNINTSDVYRDVRFINTNIISSAYIDPDGIIANDVKPNSILRNTGTGPAQRIFLERTTFAGECTYIWFNQGNRCVIEDFRTSTGYTSPIISNNSLGYISDRAEGYKKKINLPIVEEWSEVADNGSGIRMSCGKAGALQFSSRISNTWYPRIGFDINNRRLYLGEINVDPFISRGTIPSTGLHAKASMILFDQVLIAKHTYSVNINNTVEGGQWIPAGFAGEYSGIEDPEGSIVADYGTRYTRRNTDTGQADLYIKRAGGNTNTFWTRVRTDYNSPSFKIETTTNIPTDASLNSAFAQYVAGSIVFYPNLANGGKFYIKQENGNTGSWSKGYINQPDIIEDTVLTNAQTSITLNTKYPNVITKSKVIAPNVGTGMIYIKKSDGNWIAISGTNI